MQILTKKVHNSPNRHDLSFDILVCFHIRTQEMAHTKTLKCKSAHKIYSNMTQFLSDNPWSASFTYKYVKVTEKSEKTREGRS